MFVMGLVGALRFVALGLELLVIGIFRPISLACYLMNLSLKMSVVDGRSSGSLISN